MALQSSGVISLNDIHKELESASGQLCSLDDSDFRNLAGISSSTISIDDFYGLSTVTVETFEGLPRAYFKGEYATWTWHSFNVEHSGFSGSTSDFPSNHVGAFDTGFSVSSAFASSTYSGDKTIKINAFYTMDLVTNQTDKALRFDVAFEKTSEANWTNFSNGYWNKLKIWELTSGTEQTTKRPSADSDGIVRAPNLTLLQSDSTGGLQEGNFSTVYWLPSVSPTMTDFHGFAQTEGASKPYYVAIARDFDFATASRTSTVTQPWLDFSVSKPEAIPGQVIKGRFTIRFLFELDDVSIVWYEGGSLYTHSNSLNGNYVLNPIEYDNLKECTKIQMRWRIENGRYYGRRAASSSGHAEGSVALKARVKNTYRTIKNHHQTQFQTFDYTQDWVTVATPAEDYNPSTGYNSGFIFCDLIGEAESNTQYQSKVILYTEEENNGTINLDIRFINKDGTVGETYTITKPNVDMTNPRLQVSATSTDTRFGGF